MGAELESSTVPSLLPRDLKGLTLDRLEAFVLSQIDGSSSLDELASLAGVPLGEVRRIVTRLHELGTVNLPGRARPRNSKQIPAVRRPTSRSLRAVDGRSDGAPAGPRGEERAEPATPGATPVFIPTSVPRLTGKSIAATGAKEAFLLAQVDGKTTVADLAAIAGLELGPLTALLNKLARAGVLGLDPPGSGRRASRASSHAAEAVASVRPAPGRIPRSEAPRARTQTRPPAAARTDRVAERPPVTPGPAPRAPTPPAPVPAKPAAPPAADGACYFELEMQARIDELFARLSTATHYDILGVERDADKKVIKGAFYAFAATLHPDRHFRKNLGPFKQKLNDVFVRLSVAYETLSKADTRAEYDRRLPPMPRRPAVAASRAAAAPAATPARPVAPGAAPPAEVKPAPVNPVQVKPAPDPVPAPRTVHVPEAARREAFATRLSRPASVPPRPADEAPSVDPGIALRRFFEEKVERAGRQRARVFAEAGEYALAKGDVVAAAMHFKLALDCCEAPELRAAFEDADAKAQVRKFDTNMHQGEEAERAEQWAEAAKRFAKAYAAKAQPKLAERLSRMIVRSGGDVRRAVKVAEEAVLAEPQNAAYRVTLGEAYEAAGLGLRARAEAERAIAMASTDPRAKALLARTAKARG